MSTNIPLWEEHYLCSYKHKFLWFYKLYKKLIASLISPALSIPISTSTDWKNNVPLLSPILVEKS